MSGAKLRYGALPDPLQQPYTGNFKEEKEKKDWVSWKDAVKHLEYAPETRRDSLVQTSWAEIKVDAERSEEHEHSLTLWESLRIYKAVSLREYLLRAKVELGLMMVCSLYCGQEQPVCLS